MVVQKRTLCSVSRSWNFTPKIFTALTRRIFLLMQVSTWASHSMTTVIVTTADINCIPIALHSAAANLLTDFSRRVFIARVRMRNGSSVWWKLYATDVSETGRWRDCTHEHVDILQELINCLANTNFNFIRTQLSFVKFPPWGYDSDE